MPRQCTCPEEAHSMAGDQGSCAFSQRMQGRAPELPVGNPSRSSLQGVSG